MADDAGRKADRDLQFCAGSLGCFCGGFQSAVDILHCCGADVLVRLILPLNSGDRVSLVLYDTEHEEDLVFVSRAGLPVLQSEMADA